MDYYSDVKNNEIMLFAGERMELKIIILSKIRQRKILKMLYFLF
jgi:hypothetical protein